MARQAGAGTRVPEAEGRAGEQKTVGLNRRYGTALWRLHEMRRVREGPHALHGGR